MEGGEDEGELRKIRKRGEGRLCHQGYVLEDTEMFAKLIYFP